MPEWGQGREHGVVEYWSGCGSRLHHSITPAFPELRAVEVIDDDGPSYKGF